MGARGGSSDSTNAHNSSNTSRLPDLRMTSHPKVVQELQVHSTIAMTLDTYSCFVPDMQDNAVSAMDEGLLNDSVGGVGDEGCP